MKESITNYSTYTTFIKDEKNHYFDKTYLITHRYQLLANLHAHTRRENLERKPIIFGILYQNPKSIIFIAIAVVIVVVLIFLSCVFQNGL